MKATAKNGLKIADPTCLLEWLATDRCLVTLGDGKHILAKAGGRAALRTIIREWIGQL